MFRRIFAIFSVCSLALTFALTAEAQQGTAAITGVVTDSSGAIIPGVNVTLRNPQTGVTLKAKTESAGAYTIKLVPPGPGYVIKFEYPGFSAMQISGLYLNVDTTRTQDTKLQAAGGNQTIEVSAANESETINTTDAQVGTSVEVQVLNELPVQDRDTPATLFTLLPGITSGGATTGGRVDQTNVTIDGLDVNDNETGGFKSIVANAPIDSVQEFHGVVGGQLSSSGEGGGAQYQMVTKGGSNHFHGSLYEYHRDTLMEANDWFNNNEGLARTPLIRNQFGGSVGGPALKDKLFFFFSYQGGRITQSSSATRTIPLPGFRAGTVSYESTNGGTNTLSADQVKSLDPAGIGFNSSLMSLISSRYPEQTNNPAYGDGLNNSGYTFTYPAPHKEDNYVQRVDYKMTPKVSFEGVGHFTQTNDVNGAPQFPGDPETFPYFDKSYNWAGINTWVIGSNKTNQVEVGETYEDYSFPCIYNPEGDTQFGSLGGDGSGGSVISGPYAGCGNAQARSYPILMIKDDFAWTKGRHDITVGGQIKRISPNNSVILNYNGAGMGLGGFVNSLSSPDGTPSLRPKDLATKGNAVSYYDKDFALALAPYTSDSATYNYNSQEQALAQGSGADQDFRFYETEIYAGDSWKVTPRLTLTYGVRWQYYTVPYERHGLQALARFGDQSISNSTFDYYFGQRLTDAANGTTGNTALPLISYVLGGKGNGVQQSYYAPEHHDFAPRVAFAYTPSFDQHTVFRGGAGLVYDHTVVSAIQYQQTQFNYLFKNSVNQNLGTEGNAYASFQSLSRFSGLNSPPAPPSAPAVTPPYTPWVNNPSTDPVPVGLLNGEFNETIDPHFKTPFSLMPTFGMQHEFPKGFILKADYVGRFGRRLMAQADMSQLVDFPDKSSGQMMSQAYSSIVLQTRACQAAGTEACTYTPQPWFEHVLTPGSGVATGYASNTAMAANIAPYVSRGDFADWLFSLAGTQGAGGAYVLPANVGMASQFAENTLYTNKGFSSYNGLLVTVHKNAGFGLTFDINYTWSHAIDNVSVTANTPAIGGSGFICDVVRPRSCRGNSDFDIAHQVNGYVTYDLPFGHGKMFGSSSPWVVNELAGGWSISALPAWHTGTPYFAGANAFVAGFANNAAAILTGNKSDMKIHIHGGQGQPLYGFANPTASVNDYEGPIGFQVGSRNDLRGPRATTLDAGVSKSFPIIREWVFKLRGDAFNVMNHPVFDNPNADITENSSPFGSITGDAVAARVLQVSGRIEF